MRRDVSRVGKVRRIAVIACAVFVALAWSGRDAAWAQNDLDARVGKELDSLLVVYKQLHANPELSTQEVQTSALIAKELRAAGFEVTDHFGQYASPETKAYGVVGVLRSEAAHQHVLAGSSRSAEIKRGEGERDPAARATFERVCAGAGAYGSNRGKGDERRGDGFDEEVGGMKWARDVSGH